jgi:transcriptional regulator with XRE-family HTH domain
MGMKARLRQRFGSRVKELRIASGLSQEAFADKCGYARTYMSRIETGRADVSLDAIETLSAALRLTPGQLFHGL